tara:strand:+ start:9468 stop:10130 length:663 start_codon:yes stop_codon:yes gene_type:complete
MPNLVGIFGGTFDPVHNGHTETIRSLLNLITFKEIRVIPNGIPPHRPSVIASTSERLQMVSMAFNSLDNIVVDDREIKRRGPSYAIDTAKEVINLYDSCSSICWIMGTDAFSSIDSWHRWEEFLDLVNIIVMSRPDKTIDKNTISYKILKERQIDNKEDFISSKKGKVLSIKVRPVKVSSSKIRHNIFSGKPVDEMIFQEVAGFIERTKLYIEKNDSFKN